MVKAPHPPAAPPPLPPSLLWWLETLMEQFLAIRDRWVWVESFTMMLAFPFIIIFFSAFAKQLLSELSKIVGS